MCRCVKNSIADAASAVLSCIELFRCVQVPQGPHRPFTAGSTYHAELQRGGPTAQHQLGGTVGLRSTTSCYTAACRYRCAPAEGLGCLHISPARLRMHIASSVPTGIKCIAAMLTQLLQASSQVLHWATGGAGMFDLQRMSVCHTCAITNMEV